MDFWIEVTHGIRWERLLKTKPQLEAPNASRYKGFFNGVKPNDIVLHYLTTALTPQKEKQSKIIAFSMVRSPPTVKGKKIIAKCSKNIEFPSPIPRKEIMRIPQGSPDLEKLKRTNFQRYLTKLSLADVERILEVHPENRCIFEEKTKMWLD